MARPQKYTKKRLLRLTQEQDERLQRMAELRRTDVMTEVRAAIDKAIEPERRSR